MEDGLERLDRERLRKFYKEYPKSSDAEVFYAQPGDEIKHSLYGSPKTSYAGFTSIEDFNKGIRDIKTEIEDYDILLKQVQSELKEIVKDLDLYNNHPELALPGEVEKLNNKYTSLLDRKNTLLEKKSKEEKNLETLIKAKKEFMSNLRETYKNEIKENQNFLDEYARAEREMKSLEAKIYAGTANNFEKERYEVLKNEVLPYLENRLNMKNVKEGQKKPEEKLDDNIEEDDEIVEEEEAPEITKESKFKKIAKKVLKIGAILGGAALVAGAVYQFIKGDANQLTDIIQNVGNTVSDTANNIDSGAMDLLSQTDAGQVAQVFDSNIEAMQSINPETPITEYFQNNILGYATPENEMIPANSVKDLLEAYNNGIDISSVYVGNEQGIDGFANQINGQELQEFLQANSHLIEGGKTR